VLSFPLVRSAAQLPWQSAWQAELVKMRVSPSTAVASEVAHDAPPTSDRALPWYRDPGLDHISATRRVDRRGRQQQDDASDAIGLVLNPNYNPQFTDADFYGFDVSKNVVIEASITDLPDNLVRESQLGKDQTSGSRAGLGVEIHAGLTW
jgi:hypothetical protein